MNKRHQFINQRGEPVDLEDGAIVPDGYGVRTPIHLQDSVQQAIATSNVRLTDALGRPAGHRPGFVFAGDGNETAAQSAHAAMVKRQEDAWRNVKDNDPAWPAGWEGPGTYRKPPDRSVEVDAARAAYITRVQNAWRTGQALPDRPAMSAWPQGGWVDKNPSPRPADVGLDAAPNAADVAWHAMVARVANAWRS